MALESICFSLYLILHQLTAHLVYSIAISNIFMQLKVMKVLLLINLCR